MNLATNLPSPELKFAQGVRKGKPLDDAGDYKIVTYQGEQVAQFKNGAMARFVRETMEERIGSVIDKCHTEWVANGTVKEKPAAALPVRPDIEEWNRKTTKELNDLAEEIRTAKYPGIPTMITFGEGHLVTTEVTKPEQEIHEKLSGPYDFKIRAFRKSGRRLTERDAPIYQLVTEYNGGLVVVRRHEVGTGLREILWLYDHFRILGKLGRIHAFWKAVDLYLV